MLIPTDLRYSNDHEWARPVVTSFALASPITPGRLGDVVFVDLPKVGTAIDARAALGEVESTKSVSEIYAPVGGTVSAVNESLRGAPESVNADPYGEGWICEITTTSGADFDALLDAEGYAALTNN